MPNRVEFVMLGLDDLLLQLEQLPATLAADAEMVVEEETELAKLELIEAYPVGETHKLRAGVRTRYERGRNSYVGFLESNTAEAVWWEFGTENRATRQGWARGRVRPHLQQGLVAIGARHNRRMVDRIAELVRREGFQIDGLY